MRESVETQFELRTGGTPLVSWIVQQRSDGLEFDEIADRLSLLVGIRPSSRMLRRWVMEG